VQKDREVPDTYASTVEYPNYYVALSSSMANAAGNKYHTEVIYGHKGTIILERDRLILAPENVAEGAKGREIPVDSGNINRQHTDNWLECMRTRQATRLNPELGYKVMVGIKLGVESYREGRMKFFDARLQKVLDRGPARPGYEGDGKNAEDSRYRKRS
jgi:hypothetical protein